MSNKSTIQTSKQNVHNTAKVSRGSYLTLDQVPDNYPVFTLRLLRRLVEERRIAFSRAGRRIVLSESDIESYLENNRVEPQTAISSSRVVTSQAMSRVAS